MPAPSFIYDKPTLSTEDGLGQWAWHADREELRTYGDLARLLSTPEGLYPDGMTGFLTQIHERDRTKVLDTLQAAARRGGRFEFDFRLTCGPSLRWLLCRGRRDERDPHGHFVSGVTFDITESRQRDDRFQQERRLESLGRLAGGLAHEFHSLLSMSLGSCDVAQQLLPLGHPVVDSLKTIQDASKRAATLTSQLLAFDRLHHHPQISIKVDERLTAATDALKERLGDTIHVQLELQSPHVTIQADPIVFDSIIVQLATNSRDAMRSGGTVTISTETQGNSLIICIADTGPGIPAELCDRIFEPFFSTKPDDHSIGLGLAAAQQNLLRWGGRISYTTPTTGGSCFVITLPVKAKSERKAGDPGTTTAIRRASNVILVVEDDDSVRELITSYLRHQGYSILEATNGDEAIAHAQAPGARIDLLLSDVVLPNRPGTAIAHQLRQSRPSLPVILMSGYTDDAELIQRLDQAQFTFLQKPFTPKVLSDMIGRMIPSENAQQASA